MNKLSEDEINKKLAQLPDWELAADKSLHRLFEFKDFKQAFAFMTAVAPTADDLNHHPDWSNSYNTVNVHLFSHEASGLSELDFELAAKMNALYQI